MIRALAETTIYFVLFESYGVIQVSQNKASMSELRYNQDLQLLKHRIGFALKY